MASKQMSDSLSRMMAERDRQDAGHFAPQPTNQQYVVVSQKEGSKVSNTSLVQQNATFYSLSDTS